MQRNNLTLVVFFSFLGVVLAQEKSNEIQVIIDDEQEEHPGSVYIKPIGINHLIFIEKPEMEYIPFCIFYGNLQSSAEISHYLPYTVEPNLNSI